jgi:hypothetical protein
MFIVGAEDGNRQIMNNFYKILICMLVYASLNEFWNGSDCTIAYLSHIFSYLLCRVCHFSMEEVVNLLGVLTCPQF